MTINNRRVRVNDVELNIVTQGKEPVVLLVPGFPDDHTVWRNQVPALVDVGYRVIALDTRGCGRERDQAARERLRNRQACGRSGCAARIQPKPRFLLLFQKPGPRVAQQGLIIRRRSDTVMRTLTRQKRTLFKVICVGYY
jgi:pimeloyl-ACP methyl ester carboxylesterase